MLCFNFRSGEWKKASQLIGEMRRKGLKPDRYSYTSAIHACSKAGNPEEALRLLRAMEASNVGRAPQNRQEGKGPPAVVEPLPRYPPG